VGEIEDFGLRVARHLAGAYPWISAARVEVAEHPWERVGGHAFARSGTGETRTTTVTVDSGRAYVLSGLDGLVLLKTTGSGFEGFPRDRFTTLAETDDRILATAVTARWRHADPADRAPHAAVRAALVETFAALDSRALQQTLYAMGEAVLARHPGIAEIRLSLPNRHHFLQDLSPFGLDNPKVVYHADDRPYGLIEGTVRRDDAPPAGPAWDSTPGFC
jgi:urate oxidase